MHFVFVLVATIAKGKFWGTFSKCVGYMEMSDRTSMQYCQKNSCQHLHYP